MAHMDEAIEFSRKTMAAYERGHLGLVLLAAGLGLKGDVDEARATAAEAVKLRPDRKSITQLRAASQPYERDPHFVALREKTIFAGLRRAGMPEE